jgi:hypothetical protein
MEFKRRKIKGRSSDTYKEWVSDCGFFRITFHNNYGFRHYYACVKVESRNGVSDFVWDFAFRRGPHRTFKKAVESCEKSKRLWDAFIKLSHSKGRRDGKLLELRMRAPTVFFNLPLWVRKEADPSLIRMLFPSSKPQVDSDENTDNPSSSSATEPAEAAKASKPAKSRKKKKKKTDSASSRKQKGKRKDYESTKQSNSDSSQLAR